MAESNNRLIDAFILLRGGKSVSTVARYCNMPLSELEFEWEQWLGVQENEALFRKGIRGFSTMEAALFKGIEAKMTPPSAPGPRKPGRPPKVKPPEVPPQAAPEAQAATPAAAPEDPPVGTPEAPPAGKDQVKPELKQLADLCERFKRERDAAEKTAEGLQGMVRELQDQLVRAGEEAQKVRANLKKSQDSEVSLIAKLAKAEEETRQLRLNLAAQGDLTKRLAYAENDIEEARKNLTPQIAARLAAEEQVKGLEDQIKVFEKERKEEQGIAAARETVILNLASQIKGLEHLETLGRTLASVAAGVEVIRQRLSEVSTDQALPEPEPEPRAETALPVSQRVAVEGFVELSAFLRKVLGGGQQQRPSGAALDAPSPPAQPSPAEVQPQVVAVVGLSPPKRPSSIPAVEARPQAPQAQPEEISFRLWSLGNQLKDAEKERDQACLERASKEEEIKLLREHVEQARQDHRKAREEAQALQDTLKATEVSLAIAQADLRQALKERDAGREVIAEYLKKEKGPSGASPASSLTSPSESPVASPTEESDRKVKLGEPGPAGGVRASCASPDCKTPEAIGKVIKGMCNTCYQREWGKKRNRRPA